ncbi:MAG: polyisoprenoid-binding protein [Elusimicrobia bacterium]|nr:polyisoprenoid-binding protein [Elusimicrobiota bacterium]
MRKTLALTLALGCLAGPLAAKTYEIDLAHSGVMFRVDHLVISKVSGRFEKFSGVIEYDSAGDPKNWKAEATIDATSINTNEPARDKHLRSADFLNVEKNPKILFKTVKVVYVKDKKAKKQKAKAHGDLTINGVSKPVILDVQIGGLAKDPWGNERLGLTATTMINRKDFGVTWNKALETGGLLVGEEIEVTLEIEGIAKKN